MRGSRIAGLGRFLPPRVVTNDELGQWMETSDDWIRQRTGIRERRWVDGDVGASQLAESAALDALAQAGLRADQLDLIVFATLSPDIQFPGSSCLLQARLDCPGIATLDIRNQCTGFVYGLAVADQFIRGGMMSRVLVVGAEVHSTALDLSTRGRDVTVLFGDGAGAAVLVASDDEHRIIDHRLHGDGRDHGILSLRAPASGRSPRLTHEMLDQGLHYPHMDGRAVFKRAVNQLPGLIQGILADNGFGIDDLTLLVPHQANRRINELVARRLGLEDERVVHNIERYGNTTAASIPIALSEAVESGRLRSGDLIVTAALGAGLTWGANLIRW